MLLDQLLQAVTLFGLGMGTVFVLLTLLIACVSLLSTICQKFEGPNIQDISDISGMSAAGNNVNHVSEQEKAIVVTAVQMHRQAKGL